MFARIQDKKRSRLCNLGLFFILGVFGAFRLLHPLFEPMRDRCCRFIYAVGSYETIQSNEKVFKGKIVFPGQMKYNYAHKERCFVEYDEFNTNCAENKILKSTLLYLYKLTTSSKNMSDIKTLLNAFSEVDESNNYQMDFARIVPDRKNVDYKKALLWSKIFLMGQSFNPFSGSQVAFALLFPMEKLFESYIAAQLKKMLGNRECTFSAQDRTYHLFDEPEKFFLLKPDIVIENQKLRQVFVMDTKWKVLSDSNNNYGISQGDMYQMYAYQKKYNAQNITLLYPLPKKVAPGKIIEFRSKDGTHVKVRFVDLFDINKSLNGIIEEIHPV